MKRFTWKAIFVMAVFFTSFHQAGWGQLVYDDFTSYTLGNLAGQGSWVKGGTGPDATVANAAPLTYAGYNGGGAEYVVMPTGTSTASRVYKLFAPVTTYNSTTFYYSLLLRVTTPGASSNGYFMSFGNAAGATASLGGKLYVKASGAGFNIGVSKTTTSAVTYGTTVLTIGQTYLIVVRYTFNLAGTTAPNCYDDQAYLWVDPVITSEPSTATAECSINGGATTDTDFDGYGAIAGGVGSFLWHSRNATNPIGDFDAVRVGHGITSSDAWTNLGAGSSVPSVETPVISPASGIFETTQTITITCATADAAIYYSTDGQPPDDSSNPYDPLNKPQVSITTTIMAIAYKAPLAPSSVASAIFRFPISVSNILALQGGDKDGFTVYKLTGEAVVTYTRPLVGGNNQKFIQDATGAVLIHDPSGIITTPYVIGDGVTGLRGTLTLYNQLLEFIPTSDQAIITSTGNVIIPEVKTLATITSADQSKLVSVAGVSFADSSTVFYTSKNYTISDVSGPSIFRTGFAEANYIGTAVPHSPRTLVALVGQYLTTMQITSRSLADIIAPPALSITPATLTGFEYIQNNGPSAGQSFAISGENLSPASGDLIVTGSTNYEVSSDNVTFGPTALIPYTGGSLTSVNAWVRLKAGLTAGNYNGEIVAVSGGTATTQNVTCSGTVLPPGPAIIVGTITGFGSQAINTTSAEKSYLVSGAYLLGNIVIVPPTGFEISLLSGESFVPSNPIVMIPSGGIVDPKLIYVRFKPTLVQPYAGDIIHTSIGATTQNVAVSGTGVWGEPTNHVTAFAAGTTTLTTIPLTWTDATGGTLPEAYLIKGSATSYSAIVDPLDGTPEVNSLLVQNVLQGVGNHAFTGLNSATTYYFKIYPYTNTGTAIDYKTSPVAPEASATTQSPPETTVKWDGGAGTDAWADASNWDNNIVPAATDHVLLDNSLVTGTYAVILPAGAVKTIIKKLTISPAISNTITLTLPVGNTYGVTGDAGFVVGDNTASTDDIIIHSGGILINSSGAAAGNGIQVNSISNGTCRINNGGKYVHNTSRSAGGIIPALSTVAGTENGTYEYDVPGTGSASITASGRTFGNLTLTRTAGAAKYTASGGSALTIRGNFHFNSGVKFFSTMTGAMNLSGNLTNNGDTVLISTTQTVNLNGSAGQIIEGTSDKTICGGLNINDAGGITLNAPRITVNGNLTFTAGLFTLGANDMRLGPLSAIAGTPAETSMIVATSAGQVKKEFATGFTGSFTFPVGNNTPAAEYSPVTLNFTSGTFGAANFAGVNLVNAKYPSDPNNLNYLRRYWNLTQSGITGFTCDATFQYLTGDVNGNEAKIFCVKVDLSPYVAYAAANTSLHQLTATGLTALGTFTGSVVVPDNLDFGTMTIGSGTTTCFNAKQTITVAGNGANFLIQTGGSVTMIAGQNIIFLPSTKVEAGGYLSAYITLTSTYCGAKAPAIVESENKELNVTTLQSKQSTFRVYPNPTSGSFTLDMTGTDESSAVNVEIYRMTGESIVRETLKGEAQHQFNLQNQPTGIYILRILNSDMAGTVKIIKQ